MDESPRLASRLLAVVLFPAAMVIVVPLVLCFAVIFYIFGAIESIRQFCTRRRGPVSPLLPEPRREPHFVEIASASVRRP
jgi:hypothetical protein